MAFDEDRILKMQRDAENAPAFYAVVKIRVGHDGQMSIDGPFGDKQLFLQILDQAKECVKAQGKDRGTLLVPAAYGDALARPEGYF